MRLLLGLTLLLEGSAAVAGELAGSIGGLSDYRFRGVSLTNGPAAQATISYEDARGWFAGALVSNVNLDPNGAGLSVQAYGGYAKSLGRNIAADAGVVRYIFPHSSGEPSSDYTEAFIGMTEEHVGVRVYATTSYFGSGAPGAYLDLRGSRELTNSIALTIHFGWLYTGAAGSPSSEYAHVHQLDVAAGVAGAYLGLHLELSVVGTAGGHSACNSRCAPGVVFAALRYF